MSKRDGHPYVVEVYDPVVLDNADDWIKQAMEQIEDRWEDPLDYSSFHNPIVNVIVEDEDYGFVRVSVMNIREILPDGETAKWDIGRIQLLGKEPPYLRPATKEDKGDTSPRKPSRNRKSGKRRPPVVKAL